jgi:hypothetical protein
MQDALAVVSLGYHEFLGKAWPLAWPGLVVSWIATSVWVRKNINHQALA